MPELAGHSFGPPMRLLETSDSSIWKVETRPHPCQVVCGAYLGYARALPLVPAECPLTSFIGSGLLATCACVLATPYQ